MKKVLASLIVSLSIASPAMAHGYNHGGGYGGWVPFGAGIVIGNILTQPRYYSPPPVYVYPQPQVIYQQTPPVVYGAPVQAPVVPMPGQVCELKSEMINGQMVTGNFCYYR